MRLGTTHSMMGAIPDTKKQFTFLECFSALKRAGYDCVDLNLWAFCKPDGPFGGDDWEKTVDEIGEALAITGLPVGQSHGNTLGGTEWDDPKYFNDFFKMTNLRCIEAAGRLGVTYVVFHPMNLTRVQLYDPKQNRDANLAYLAPYIEAAKKAGVGVAVENMVDFGRFHRRYCGGDITELIDLVDTINDKDVGICFDTGHGNISGMHAGAAIRAMGKRLVCTHINDNYAQKGQDAHQAPFFGNVNWKDAMKAFGEIDYQGDFTYEFGSQKLPPEGREAWLKYTVELGRMLIGMAKKD